MKAQSSTRSSISFAGFRLDMANECLWRLDAGAAPERVDLTPKTYGVLRFLVENRGALITHHALLEAVWPDVHVQPEVVKAQIQMIRTRLGDSAQHPRYIETLRGRGPVNGISANCKRREQRPLCRAHERTAATGRCDRAGQSRQQSARGGYR
jgi:DNA-binding winged helix-turn-helix (wHTH) protein